MDRPKILVIDDEPDFLKVISARLEHSGFKVYLASGGEEALKLIDNEIPDIVILDILMSKMDGYEVLRRIRSSNRTADIPVIILSGMPSQGEKSKALDMGADDYITKPYHLEEFLSRINALLRRSSRKNSLKNIKNILITGGCGFLGSHLARALLVKNYNVCLLDDLSTGREENIKDIRGYSNLKVIRGSITDETILSKAIEQSDLVYHLAATVGVKNVVVNPLDTLIYDTFGSGLVLKYASAKGIKVIFTSTSEVYGKSPEVPFLENTDLIIGAPGINRWSYACSKLFDEFLAIAYNRERGLAVVVVRLFNVVGPGQMGRYGMVMPRFFKSALKNEPIVIYGDGKQSRCFTYVDDVIRILIELAGCECAEGEIINLGSDKEISIKNLAVKIKEITKSSSKITFEPYSNYYGSNFQDIKRRVPDLRKLKEIMGRVPETGIDEILEKTKEYFLANPQELNDI